MKTHLGILLPPPLTGRGTGYTCARLAQGMAGPDLDVAVVTPRSNGHGIGPARTVQVVPPWMRRLPYRWLRARTRHRVEEAFLRHMDGLPPGRRAAYVWADAGLPTFRALREAGIPIFHEMINGPRGTAKSILDDAYARCGTQPSHGIDEAAVAHEDAMLALADHVFCPNALVEAALLERGIQATKLISASYGWDPGRFAGRGRLLPPAPGLTVVFVGSLSLRKGVHLLLDYWARSGVRGRLVLAGTMDPVIRDRCAALLARDDVVVLDYVADIGGVYRAADLFVFPSLEEGGPQVTYEACGCGLPALTTPMGAGRIIRHGREGLVLAPYDDRGWIDALQAMAEDHGRRKAMAQAAEKRAQEFCWNRVAGQRRDAMASRLAPPPRPSRRATQDIGLAAAAG